MKFVLVLLALVAITLAAPVEKFDDPLILRYDNDNIGVGPYNWE